ncbi:MULTISPECIES: PA2817 family protein [Oceanospirillaceae]|jgi:hypothetical protein|uniref:PA2817 family protein n=1 Tax=Oceanobacter antarcticus TaxID=3133425 RepID=A0ABW8NGA4_9GAMM|tara:strand:- start:121 stop:429 length:309 start_codon:yes stop_codon:yes gene_type:complete
MSEQPNHIRLLQKLKSRLEAASESEVINTDMIHQLAALIDQLTQQSETAYEDTRQWLNNLMMHTPQLAPAIDRELLWIFGGDCLHYLTDEEIRLFQQQDEEN